MGAGMLGLCWRSVWVAGPAIQLPLGTRHPARMIGHFELDSDARRLLRAVRDARFADGFVCPHCDSRSVVRWGRARGRQRYRCRACRRTFSDLTGTPFMYSKRLGKWPRYLACVDAAASVRRSALLVGIHPTTAFYWRHRLLDHALAADHTKLAGVVELTSFRMEYSEKGSRSEPRDWPPRVHVIWARDRRGASFALPQFADHAANFATTLADRLTQGLTLVTDGRRFSGAGIFARRHPGAVIARPRFMETDSKDTALHHVAGVMAEIARFRTWLRPFRGVATAYLANYLAWHRKVDAMAESQAGVKWVQATSAPPTLSANSAPVGAAGSPAADPTPAGPPSTGLATATRAPPSSSGGRRGARQGVRAAIHSRMSRSGR